MLTFSNNVLQGDFGQAGNTAARFAINTTVGILGIFDPAARLGFEEDGKEGIPLWTYVNDIMSGSKHDLFKDYTFLITRLFDARVKSFTKNILMGGGRKVKFKYYSYRVEFQARGYVILFML